MILVKKLTKIYKIYKKTGNILTDLFFRQYKDLTALDDVSFKIDDNELVGFIGPNGAGKTTTLKILSGILYPTKGEVKINGFIPFEKKPQFLRQITFVMGQKSQLFWDLPAMDTFLLNKEIYQIKDDQFKKTLNNLTDILNCSNLINKPVKMLSLGERMKMEFIASLLHQPKIVFLDEPTIGLDIFSQEAIRNFIKNYQKEYQATIIFTSHYLEDVKKIAKRLIIINQGKIIYDGKLADVVNKFSKSKYLSLTLEKPIDKKDLEKIAHLINYQYPKAVFEIKKTELPEKISLISQKIPYIDIAIEEEKIEEIIKKIYKYL